eukprot:scaffold53024_cov30-Tisochrysis_lutea.AAC.1
MVAEVEVVSVALRADGGATRAAGVAGEATVGAVGDYGVGARLNAWHIDERVRMVEPRRDVRLEENLRHRVVLVDNEQIAVLHVARAEVAEEAVHTRTHHPRRVLMYVERLRAVAREELDLRRNGLARAPKVRHISVDRNAATMLGRVLARGVCNARRADVLVLAGLAR